MNGGALEILAELIACDTQNPPRRIDADHSVFVVIRQHLGDHLNLEMTDHGNGCVSLLARRGPPGVLFNVHLDTVPAGDGWDSNPLEMRVDQGRVIGRGACDIKGAAACLIAAAKTVEQPLAILFTTDEEGTGNCCVSNFCQSPEGRDYELAIVAEPTMCQAVTGHRGYLSVSGQFAGTAAHSSNVQRLAESANHRAIRWAHAALQRVREFESQDGDNRSLCFNIGQLAGGTKNNVIAESCRLTWSMRPPPGTAIQQMLDLVTADSPDSIRWETTFAGSALPTGKPGSGDGSSAIRLCKELNLECSPPVDFWTEASIFSESGIPALVLGPGHIDQAHTANEWVATAQLEKAVSIYQALMTHSALPRRPEQKP